MSSSGKAGSAGGCDVVVVGGGPAGLNAALVLGRMRRRVLLVDTEAPANAVSEEMHGFLSRDGTPPADVRRVAAEQLEPYESVERRLGAAVAARRTGTGFEVELEGGTLETARRLLLAHGMHYGLPGLEGVAELWGERVFHCPYCHGWEVRDQSIAVYGSGDRSVHQALLLSALSDDVVFLSNGGTDIDGEERERLEAVGIEIIEARVERVVDDGDGLRVEFGDDRPALPRHALFVRPDLSLASDLAISLGAELTGVGSVETDPTGLSSVAGLYVAGDAGTQVQSVAVATGSGARAAYAINAELALEDARAAAA